ncbi:MAG: M24 family metallopeptidase C-terminal domain-containing protein, partial [Methylocella sp.]
RREIAGSAREMLGFETLTLAPLALALIAPKLLDGEEIGWLNAYHARVWREISPLVEPGVRRWLRGATRRIGARR